MTDQLGLSVVMPVYNEGLNIEKTLHALKSSVAVPHEVIIVYDHEEDNTLPVVRSLMPSYPGLQLLRNRVAPGPGPTGRPG